MFGIALFTVYSTRTARTRHGTRSVPFFYDFLFLIFSLRAFPSIFSPHIPDDRFEKAPPLLHLSPCPRRRTPVLCCGGFTPTDLNTVYSRSNAIYRFTAFNPSSSSSCFFFCVLFLFLLCLRLRSQYSPSWFVKIQNKRGGAYFRGKRKA